MLLFGISCLLHGANVMITSCSDVLCSSGWTRDEVKESNWALIQYKTRPLNFEKTPLPNSDVRTESNWFLVEEVTPADYRQALLATPVSS